MSPNKRLAYWVSDKKSQKIDWKEFESVCNRNGFDLFKLDLDGSLESQEPFCAILHKLTDIIAAAQDGDEKNFRIITKLQDYLQENPKTVVIDPIPNVKTLLDRFATYSLINSTNLPQVFTPNFCKLESQDISTIKKELLSAKVTYPFLCKPTMGHGSRQAHKMSIIFNEKHLLDCKIPCVAQSFINHNAVLYKIFVVGRKSYFTERPSLKNFYSCDRATINFDSGDISKAGAQNKLCILDVDDMRSRKTIPDVGLLEKIGISLGEMYGMDLIGVDVVIDNGTGKYGIVDVNAYPGYDGFPNFFEALLECIKEKVELKSEQY